MNSTEAPRELPPKARRRITGNGAGYIAEDLRTLLADVEELLRTIADIGEAEVVDARAKVTRALAEARRTLGDSTGSMRARARLAADAADQYVRGRPWTAVGLAAAIGLILGVGAILGSRRQRA